MLNPNCVLHPEQTCTSPPIPAGIFGDPNLGSTAAAVPIHSIPRAFLHFCRIVFSPFTTLSSVLVLHWGGIRALTSFLKV